MGTEDLLRVGDQMLPDLGNIRGGLLRLRMREIASRTKRDVRQIAPSCGIVPDLHVRVEDRSITLADRVDEVFLVEPGAAVAAELLDDLAALVEGDRFSALSLQPSTLTVGDVAAPWSRMLG